MARSGPDWLPQCIAGLPEPRLILYVTALAFAVRIYLVLTEFCISADGPAYIHMAREFGAGHSGLALSSVFSPLFPWLISIVHHAVPDWELAGELISALFGTITIPIIYWLIREAFERRDLAAGAALLAALHPELAAYSASVRTEAGFICLMVASVSLFIVAVKRNSALTSASAGLVGGLAYLYRAEAIGLPIVLVCFLIVGVRLWRRWTLGAAMRLIVAFAAPFLAVASPYLIYLHSATGHWIVSRELNLTAASSVMEIASNKAPWQALATSKNTSILAPLLLAPSVYLEKIAYDVGMSFYYFPEGMEPPLAVLLVLGLWSRGRQLFESWAESLLAVLMLFYFFGFALFNTGPRFMVHLIPYAFGWTIIGAEVGTRMLARLPFGKRMPAGALLGVILLALLPRTLWPLGYDLRGLRYAGADMTRLGPRPRAIVASDARAAFYAGARRIPLVLNPKPSLCSWLLAQPGADYMLIDTHEERKLGKHLSSEACLTLVRRYPRKDNRYYCLYAIDRAALK
jgi:4-amino-4-deoxy-L-arabinose transferase-like glycosyltransferase